MLATFGSDQNIYLHDSSSHICDVGWIIINIWNIRFRKI
jgi:hypothetical protein